MKVRECSVDPHSKTEPQLVGQKVNHKPDGKRVVTEGRDPQP